VPTKPGAISDAEMRSRYESGQTVAEVAAAAGLDQATVWRRLKQAGVVMRPAARKPERSAEILRRHRDGQDPETIAAAIGGKPGTVKARLREHGLKTSRTAPRRRGGKRRGRPRSLIPAAARKRIAAAYQAGESMRAIAAAEGIAEQTVRNALLAQGVPLRGRAEVNRLSRPGVARRLAADLPGAAERYQAGESLQALGAAYGVKWRTVRRHLERAGVPLRGTIKPPADRSPSSPRAGVIQAGSRAHRVLAALAGHPEGLSSRQLAELHGENAGQRTLTKYGSVLRDARDSGYAEQAGTTPAAWQQPRQIVYRITDAGREALARAQATVPGEEDEEIAGAYRAGDGVPAIAAARGISPYKVREALRRQQVPLRTRGDAVRARIAGAHAELDRDAIVAAYKAGMPVDRIRREHRAQWYTIRQVLADAGIETGPRGGSRADIARVREQAAKLRRDLLRRRDALLDEALASDDAVRGRLVSHADGLTEAITGLEALLQATRRGVRRPGETAVSTSAGEPSCPGFP
jgi:hypothetical protein